MTGLDKLRQTAEQATEGPWQAVHRNVGCTEHDDESAGLGLEIEGPPKPGMRGQFSRSADARFIATFDPPTVLALLDVAETAEGHRGCHGAGMLEDALDRLREVTADG